jgi:hypothetical protein
MPSKKKKSTSIFESLRKSTGNPTYGRKQFKRDVNKLIKQGLYTPKLELSDLNPSRYINSLLRRYQDVLGGTAQAIKVNPGEVKKYQEAGYRTSHGRAIVELPKGARAKRIPAHEGVPRFQTIRRAPQGVETVTNELVPPQSLEARIRRAIEREPALKKGEYYGVRFYGNNSARYWSDKEVMLQVLMNYPSVQEAMASENPEYEDEYYQNFRIVRFKNTMAWENEYNERQESLARTRSKAARERYRERQRQRYAAMDELERRIYRERTVTDRAQRAERERNRRNQLKHDDPSAYARMLEENAARVRKSRANKK